MEVRRLLLKQNSIGKVCVSKLAEKNKLNFKKIFKGQQAGVMSTVRKLA